MMRAKSGAKPGSSKIVPSVNLGPEQLIRVNISALITDVAGFKGMP